MARVRYAGLSVAAVLAVATVNAAMAATVIPGSGAVLINRGKGFANVSGATDAAAGDVVMTRDNGSADIVYNDSCRVRVENGQVVRVADTPPCVAGGAGAAAAGVSTSTVVIGAAVVAGGVLGAVALSGGGGDSKAPASP